MGDNCYSFSYSFSSRTVDLVTKEIHPLAKVAKDCGSAAAFVSSIMVFIICCFIFIPKIIALF